MDHLCYFCLVFFMLLRQFFAALWLPAGKGLTSCLLLVMFYCVFCYFSMWYPESGVVLDCVSFPDLCLFSYIATWQPCFLTKLYNLKYL